MKFSFFCLFLFLSTSAFSQTFYHAGGRNHPELNWVVSETEHFRIVYPSTLDGMQDHAAAIAEETYQVLSVNFGFRPKKKIRIYLSGHDEITNGFAVPINDAYTNIWVNVNDYAVTWTGEVKWLRKVISHELAHIFHFEAVRSAISPFDVLFASPLPRFWTEGLAQYETEHWDARRGDRWLRIAAFENRLSYNDGQSAWNRRLMYASGSSQVRYFASQYGDSTLASLLQHRKPVLPGLAGVHDFNAAFKATTGQSYNEFYEDWKKHTGVYYNTMAGQMDRLDSLHANPLPLPATWYRDIQYSRDTTQIAVLGMISLERPVTGIFTVSNDTDRERRVLATGPINPPISWHPAGDRIAYSRTGRGTGGSIINDLYMAEFPSGDIQRLTRDRRARSPVFSPGGNRLAFIQSRGNTDNIVVRDLSSGRESRLTFFEGDVQLLSIQWHPAGEQILVSRFTAERKRDIVVLDAASRSLTPLTDGSFDDRFPVWNSTGSAIAYTSLRDGIENVFMQAVDRPGEPVRVTHLFTGGTVRDWLAPDSLHRNGRLVIQSTETKRWDEAYLIGAGGKTALSVGLPADYAAWTTHRPPREIADSIRPDASLIHDQYPYNSFANLSHVLTLALPYWSGDLTGENEYGLAMGTAWIEPVGKHMVLAGGGLSFTDMQDKSFFYLSYTNRQLRPSLRFDVYKRKPSAGQYGHTTLFQERDGGQVSITQPLDWFNEPYTTSEFQIRVRHTRRSIYNPEDFTAMPSGLSPPSAGRQTDIRLTYRMKRQLPSRSNVIQQLEGWGIRLRVTAAVPGPFTDSSYFRPDLAAYAILPALGRSRFYAYVRGLALYGDPFPQDFIGFTRSDYVTVPFDDVLGLFQLPAYERVRGYREFLTGDQLLFGTLEYRMPFINLRTTLLGTAVLGQSALSPFLDAGSLRYAADEPAPGRFNRTGTGIELKNVLQVGGLRLVHALGIAQPVNRLGFDEDYDLFYRIRATVPF
ncbi:MAG: BamA/TamA family outer membrane protein [Balneolales bacterium]